MGLFIQITQLLLSLCILVLLHELGHYFFARYFNTRVDKFYLFFNPWFSIFKFKRGDTVWGLGWLPIGGYCKIAGMIDESMDKEQLKQPAQPWEFRSKPAWQRLLIISGGIIMNFLLAIFLYIMILFVWGREYLPTENAKFGYAFDSVATSIGLRDGDMIVSVDNKPLKTFTDIYLNIALDKAKQIQVVRNGKAKNIEVPEWLPERLTKYEKASFIVPRFPFQIDRFEKNSPGQMAGLKEGDIVIGINNDTAKYFNEFRSSIVKHINKDIRVVVLRGADTVSVIAHVPASGLLGIGAKGMDQYLKFSQERFGLLQSIPAGIKEGFSTLGTYVSSLKMLFRPQGYKNMGTIFSLTKAYSPVWDWHSFFAWTAFLSIILAFMNILPIPALDGGYILFILYEMILRRKPSDKFLEYAQMTGMILLLTLMAFALFNDITRFVIK